MWQFVALATCVSFVVGCWSLEMGIIVALVIATCVCMTTGADAGPSGGFRDPSSARRSTAQPAASRSARMASNTGKDEARRGRPIIRESTVKRTPLQAIVPEHPVENVLDAAMLHEQTKRSRRPDARSFHMVALPNALRAAARELTTADPAITPLSGPEACYRDLGTI